MNRHTPGPWVLDSYPDCDGYKVRGGTVSYGEKQNGLIAVVKNQDTRQVGQAPANARLITAAPDLLTACRIASVNAKHNRMTETECWTTCPACVIEKAIAKAESR